jgi:hypothetical protein
MLLTAGPLLLSLSSPGAAVEVAAYTPDPSLLPARQAVEAPLRVAEALSLAAVATLAPAREGAASELAALAAWNEDSRRPPRVGFGRALGAPLDLRYDGGEFAARLGRRVGGASSPAARTATGSGERRSKSARRKPCGWSSRR